MKSNVLKSSLAAFAFTLAIVVSFAFSPTLNSTDEFTTVQGYIHTTNPAVPCAVSINTCVFSTAQDCTTGSDPVYLFYSEPGLTACIFQLSKP